MNINASGDFMLSNISCLKKKKKEQPFYSQSEWAFQAQLNVMICNTQELTGIRTWDILHMDKGEPPLNNNSCQEVKCLSRSLGNTVHCYLAWKGLMRISSPSALPF